VPRQVAELDGGRVEAWRHDLDHDVTVGDEADGAWATFHFIDDDASPTWL
jgi:hypothetical protein